MTWSSLEVEGALKSGKVKETRGDEVTGEEVDSFDVVFIRAHLASPLKVE